MLLGRDPAESGDLTRLRGGVLRGLLDPDTRRAVKAHEPRFGDRRPAATCAGVENPRIIEGEANFLLFWRTLAWDHAPRGLAARRGGRSGSFALTAVLTVPTANVWPRRPVVRAARRAGHASSMLDPLHEHRETNIDVPATCPIGGHGQGCRRTAAEAIKAPTCGFARRRMPSEAFGSLRRSFPS